MSLNQLNPKAESRRRPFRFLRLFIHEAVLRLSCPLLVNLPKAIQRPLVVPAAPNLCNPSILRFQNNWLIAARQPTYILEKNKMYIKGGWKALYSYNWLLKYDDSLNMVQSSLLKNSAAILNEDACQSGLEDPRLIAIEDRLFGIWSGLKSEVPAYGDLDSSESDSLPQGFSPKWTMIMAEIKDNGIGDPVLLRSPHGLRREKNWMPVVLDGVLHFIYSLNRMEVYRLGQSGLELVHKQENPDSLLADWSGSSQLIPWEGNFLCVAHRWRRRFRSVSKNVSRFYSHRFILISPEWKVIAYSAEFCFQSRGIEFCSGLAQEGDRVIVSYGIKDRAAATLEVSRGQVNKLLRPV